MPRRKKREPRKKHYTEIIYFRITPLMRERLEMVAAKTRRPVVWVIREVVGQWLEKVDGRPVEKS